MDGMKYARIVRCRTCPYKNIRYGYEWPKCLSPRTVREGQDLDDEYMETGTCPMGYWDELTPVDLEAMEREREEKRIESISEMYKKVIESLPPSIGQEDKEEFMVNIVAAGLCRAVEMERTAEKLSIIGR